MDFLLFLCEYVINLTKYYVIGEKNIGKVHY